MKTLEWQELWDAMEANPDEWISTTENMYWQMLEVLPPRKMIGENFMVGEPLRHVNGEAIYACFTKMGDIYKAKNMSVRQFLEAHDIHIRADAPPEYVKHICE